MPTPPGLNWFWIAMMAAVPSMVALLAAYPLWRRSQPILGNVLGTAIVCSSALALIFKEHAELDVIVKACLDAGTVCWPSPSAFTRYAIYAFIAMFEVFALFYFSILYEERLRNRGYAPEWRRW